MSDLPVELKCPGCGAGFRVPFSELKGTGLRCPSCGAEVPVDDEQIDAAVERRMRAQRKALKPKFGGL